MRKGSVELFERPIYFAAGDHQGWTNTDGVVVGVLAQDAATAQRVAVAPGAARLRQKLDSDHQAAAAHLFHSGVIDVAQARKEARPHHASVFDHAFFDEDLERSAGDGASERVAAESTAVLARFQHAEDLVGREHRRYRIEAAQQRLADQGQIGLDPFMLFGEQPAGAAEAALLSARV